MALQLSKHSLQTLRIESNNHLYFAHWELFRVGILTVFNQEDDCGKREIVRMLKAVYSCPDKYSSGSPSVTTPYHMQWLCAKLLKELQAEENYQEHADFKLLLLRILEFTSDCFIQDIYKVFWIAEDKCIISEASLNCYGSLINTNPQLAAELLERLMTRNILLPHFLLAEVFLIHLQSSLECVCKVDDNLPEQTVALLHAIGFLERLVEIGKLQEDFEVQTQKLTARIDNIVSLLKSIGEVNENLKTQIFFLLLPEQNTWLLKKMHIQVAIQPNDVFLKRVFGENMVLNIKELCLETLETRSHFLERILKCCLHLVEVEKLDIVLDILKPPLLDRLWPLIYILSWENVRTVNHVQLLLDHSPVVSVQNNFDPLLMETCRIICQDAKLALWCLQNRVDSKRGDEDAKIVEILQDLASHSPLFVINKVLGLNHLGKEAVVQALMDHSSYNNAITYSVSDDYLHILNDYYVIKYILEAICSGQEMDYLLRKKCHRMMKAEGLGQVTSGDNTTNLDEFYETKIKAKLKNAQSLISDIFPLPFRVQLLEDAFSLLFLQNKYLEMENDTCEMLSDEGSQGEETKDKRGKASPVEDSSIEVTANAQLLLKSNEKISRNRKFSRRTRVLSSATTTTSSSCGSKRDFGHYGKEFVCSAFVVRDLLSVLKETLLEAEISVRKHHQEVHDMKETSRDPPQKTTDLSRIARLSKFISDAIWRLHITTSEKWLESEAFTFSSGKFCDYFTKIYPDSSCKVPVVFHVVERDGSSTDDESKSKSKVSHEVVRRCSRLLAPQRDTSVIRLMLSSQESLIYMCLHRNQLDLVKAEQAIKMFNLRDSDCAREVRFMKAYKRAAQQLCISNQSEKPTESLSVKVETSSAPQPMRKLSKVAGEAIKAALTTEVIIVDELLSMYPVPFPVMSNDTLFQNEDMKDNFAKALVISDLVSVSACDVNSSLRLLNLAKERLPKHQKGNKPLNIIRSKIWGFLDGLTQLAETQLHVSSRKPCFGSFGSLNELISSWCWSLDSKNFKRVSGICWKMNQVLEGRHEILEISLKQCDVSTEEHPFNVLVCDVNEMAVELAAEFIFELLALKSECRATAQVPCYLKMILDYANSLKSLLGKCGGKEEELGPESSLSLLRLPQKEIIKKLLQNHELTADKLHEFAKQSKLDLASLIIQQCTPRIPIDMQDVSINGCEGMWKNGHYVLNGFSTYNQDSLARHPEVVVGEILQDIIVLMKGRMEELGNGSSVFSYKMALEFCQTPSCWQVLGRTQELCHVDLTSLQSTNQQTAFFTNVSNLITLHALMVQFRHFTTPSLLSPQLVLRMAAEEQFAYRIGQLGIVSLLDLRKQILRSEGCSSLDYATTLADVAPGSSEILKVDPRLIFAMSYGTVHSPKLQVLYAERLDDQLLAIFHKYLIANVQICMDTPKIKVPQLVVNYISDLDQQPDNNLIDFLTSDIVPQEISEVVAELKKTHLVSNLIHIEPFNYKFLYIFDYNTVERVETDEHIPEVVPSNELQCPSEAVFEYLGTCCPLAATLTNLLQENGVERGKLETEFPVLHRYLQQWVVKVEDFYTKIDVQNAFCSKSALTDAWLCFDTLTEPIQVDECFRQLEMINAIGYWRHDNVLFIEDVVLENIVASLENEYNGDNCPWNLASRIRDETRRACCVLRNYGKWPPDAALQCLTLCRNLRNIPKQLRCKLSIALTKLTIYEKVCSLVKNGEVNLTACSTWVTVERAWLEDPGKILNAFFVARKFQLVVDWADSHKITEPFKQLVEECRVLSVLGENIVDPIIVKSIADSVPEPLKASKIFLKILPYVKHLEVQLHIANFLLEEETVGFLLDNDRCKVWERKIAIQIMLCVPEDDRKDYRIFLDYPLAFVEQLLINMKMEILLKAITAIRDDLVTCPSTSGQISLDAINNVLEVYAEKAIDFKVVYRKPQATKSASSCTVSTNPSKQYVKPAVPPKKQDWVPDSEVTKCMVCKLEPFSMFNRRHHCRRCGRVVCAACSQNRAIVKGYQEVLVRVCDECLETSTSKGNETASRSPSLSRFRLISSSSDGDQSALGEGLSSELKAGSLGKLFPAQRVLWKLSCNSSHDSTLREEFFYEQAPSVPLCLSILDLHSDQGKCATFSLRLVRNIFHLLLPIGPGTANREIDYSLTISMTLSLLLSAKVNFSKACLWDQVNECDSLLGLADIFKLLVAADCQHLMPYGDLDDPDILRRLRDRLMEEEIWKVALEVSTKSGQDVDSVLVTWAMFCLRSGQLDAAREKFSRCLRKSHDGYHATLNNLTLPKILDCLDNLTSKSAKVSSLQTRLQQIKSGNSSSNPVSNNDGLCETLLWNESVYYLNMYGTHKQFLNFYLRKHRIDLALQHIIDKKCDLSIFLDGIWKPAVESGKMKILLDSLTKHDRLLAVWNTYISGLCGFLERRKHWNQLYFVQKFCKDHIRAAFTCIHFYKDIGRTYLELYERLRHLADARLHFEQYLSAKTDPSPIRMQLPRQDIHRHISAIELQVQVTKFLQRNWNNTKRLMTATQSPPTAFDSNAVRALLAALVLLAGSRIEDGFGIAYRIIQEFHLKADKVYCLCAKKLVQHSRLADVNQLIDAVNQSASVDANVCDVILMTALDEAIILKAELQQLEPILKLLTGESSKIQAFIRCGKLKSAYLLAVKCGSAADVQLICSEATRLQQTSLQNICQKWLIAHNINPQ